MEELELLDIASMLVPNDDVDTKDEVEKEEKQEIEVKESQDTDDVEEKEEVEEKQEAHPSSVKQIYEELRNLGLPLEDKEDVTQEWLEQEWEKLPDRVMDTLLNNIPSPVGKDLLIYAVNKPNLSEKDLVDYVEQFVKKDSTYDITTIEGARNFLKNNEVFKTAYEEDEIDEALDALEDKEKLLSRAEKLYNEELSKKTKAQEALTKKAQEEKEATLQRQKEFQANLQKEIEELGWKDTRKKAVINNLQPQRINAVNAAIQSSPKAVVQLANLYDYFDLEKGNFDKLYALLEGKKQVEDTKKKLNTLEKSSGLSSLFNTKPIENKSNKKEWVPDININ